MVLPAPVMQVKDLLESYGLRAATAFDPDLLISLNLAQVDSQEKTAPYEPFGEYQKLSHEILVIQEKTSGKVSKVMLLDNDDARFFEALLSRRDIPQGNVRLGLYHFSTGVFRQGIDPIDRTALESDSRFLFLKAQAKFFSGDSNLSSAECVQLKEWLAKDINLTRLFLEDILKWKEMSQRNFKSSPLERLFNELAGAQ